MICIEHLEKSLSKNKIIDGLSLTVNDAEITALVGKNGAGKSTLIRLISGLLKPDGGRIEIQGNSSIGVLLGGDVNLYPTLTARETILYFGKLHGMNPQAINARILELDEILNFQSFLHKQTYTLSRGMRQKIAFMLSVIHNPSILLLDEPSTGLDIEAANDVIRFIKYLKSEGKTIFIATHNIFEISELSDCIAFMDCGKITEKVQTVAFFENGGGKSKNELLLNTLGGEIRE